METARKLREELGEYFPSVLSRLSEDNDVSRALEGGYRALEQGSLSWAQLNQIMHRCSEAGMSEGFFSYYFLKLPEDHPYPVDQVFGSGAFRPPKGATEIQSLQQLKWGIRRFMYDAMLYWGNFGRAYRELRQDQFEDIRGRFVQKRIDTGRMLRRGKIQDPTAIPRDHRYLISEIACKTYEVAASPEETKHVQLAIDAFRELRSQGKSITPSSLKAKTKELADQQGQLNLFELMYEEATGSIESEAEVVALYSGQWHAFQKARTEALENTRIYLSICNDLDVYVATSMRSRQDFREMTDTCDRIFSAPELRDYNLRHFDPTLSAANYHEDKGIIECLMVKTAKVMLYFSQHKESLGKVSEYAMALSFGKPVIVLCPDDTRGLELYRFYQEAHPLMRLVEFQSGVVNGAMITYKVEDTINLLNKIFGNKMEFDLDRKGGTEAYYLLKERLTGSTVRVVTDDKLLTETFWSNWHETY